MRRTILTLGHTQLFGLEEIILENPKRLIRARALEDTECFYVNKNKMNKMLFSDYFKSEDLEKFKQMVKEYTDFEREGRQILYEIKNKKNVV